MRRTCVLVGLIALGLTTGITGSLGSTAGTEYTTVTSASPDPQLKGRWAERTAAAGDLNGDGRPDYFVAAPMEDVNGIADAGRVWAVNGRTRAILYQIDPVEPQAAAKFGFFISVPGDVNGDKVADIAIGTDAQDVYTGSGGQCGTPEPNGCNEDQGKAWVYSGANGKLLYALDNPQPQGSPKNRARFGSRIGRAGDVNGDSVPDIVVGASGNDSTAGCGDNSPLPAGCRVDQGQAFVFDGKTGKLIRTLDLPAADQQPAGTCASSCGSLGIAVQGPGDTNGDGVVDQLVDAGGYSFYTGSGTPCGAPEPNGCNESQGRIYLFDGKSGRVLLHIDDPEPQAGATFGFQDAAPLTPGDVNRDKAVDLYGNGFVQNGPTGEGQGAAWVFNGKTGAVLYKLDDPTPEVGGQFGWSVSQTDYNKDGVPDEYVGQSPHHVAGATGSGGSYVFSGKDGSLLKALELPVSDRQTSTSSDLGPNLGWTNSAPGDLNHDGQPDYLAGAPFLDVNANQDEGRLYVFLSSDRTAPGRPTVRGPRKTRNTRVTFQFSSRDVDNTAGELHYRCSLTGGSLRACAARVTAKYKAGRHPVRVQAIDVAGNKSPVAKATVLVLSKKR